MLKNFKLTLAWKIFLALNLGIVLGISLHDQIELKEWIVTTFLIPSGEIFIRMIKMIVVPIVMATLIIGIAGIGDIKKLGSIGLKTIIYFEIITTLAIIIGVALANVFRPGNGIDMSILSKTDISMYEQATSEIQSNLVDTVLSLIPSNIIESMAKGDMLPVIFFSVIFGLGLASLPDKTKLPLLEVCHSIADTMFEVTNMVMRYAPIGVFALISVTVATFGFHSLIPLSKLVLLVYGSIIFFALIVLGIVARICNLRIWKIICILKEELILSFSTASSETVLPRIIKKWNLMEHLRLLLDLSYLQDIRSI